MYQLLPPLATADFQRLKESIIERGVEIPVVIDEDGEIIDGHNRVMIANSLGIEYPTIVRRDLLDHEKRILAVELNVARRHFTDAQLAEAGRRIEPDVAERARLRQVELGRSHGDPPSDLQIGRGESRDEVARTVGLGSGITYQRHKAVLRVAEQEAPDLMTAVESGDLTIKGLRRAMDDRGIDVPRQKRTKETGDSSPAPIDLKRELLRRRSSEGGAVQPNPAVVARELQRLANDVHGVLQRLRGIRAQHGGALDLGGSGEVLAGKLEELAGELVEHATDIRTDSDTTTRRHRHGGATA